MPESEIPADMSLKTVSRDFFISVSYFQIHLRILAHFHLETG